MVKAESGNIVLAASDVTDRLACPHLIAQKLAITRGERSRPRPADDPYAELIRERGEAHEREQLELLEAELGACVDLTRDPTPRGEEELQAAAIDTAETMRTGAPLIFQGVFFDGRWQGRTDFLRRLEEPSDLGSWSYEVIDTKLARAVKPHFVHQLILYSRLLADLQGRMPKRAHVILGDGSRETVEISRYAALNRYVTTSLERMIGQPIGETYPEPVAHCDICRMVAECRARLRADDHLSLIAGATQHRRERLADIEIGTGSELAAAPADMPAARLGADAFEVLRNQAALQKKSAETGQPTRRHLQPQRAEGYAALPAPDPGDVFFDLEGDPFLADDGIEYLWGWSRPGGSYEHIWAHSQEDERTALESFVDEVGALRAENPGMHVFHYAPHERAKLRSLAMKYATREEEVDELLREGVLVDLLRIVRRALQVGEESYSLKSLERHHDFQRLERSVREGGGSIVMYERWLSLQRPEMLEAIRAYNEEDCRSTESLRDWLLERMRPEAEQQFKVDFDDLREPEEEEERPPADWFVAMKAVSDELLDGLPADAAEDGPEEARRRLMAHLLLYHWRESKPEWWRYYDLLDTAPEELIWERDAIAGLEREESVPPQDVARSRDYAFRFPEQEHKLTLGQAKDVGTGENLNLMSIEEDSLVIRRRKDLPPPAPRAIIGGRPYIPAAMRDSLLEIGRAMSDGPAVPAAADALLRRTPPSIDRRFLSENPETLVEATLELDGDVLPLQGPPGTGKTYRAARMIVGALAAGRRVAVSAFSHAAIQNLLREVEQVAADWPYRFTGVYKSDHPYESAHGMVRRVTDAKQVRDEHQLAAGTAWLFSRDDQRDAFDLLFIDEAGQYSLANAVASAPCARSLVLLGDPQQLPQVTQADHPYGAGASALEHILNGANTIREDFGVLLTESWRMHPAVCEFVSEHSYDGKLQSRPACAERRIEADGALHGAGIRKLPVTHTGRSQASPEEAEAIAAACRTLLNGGVVHRADGQLPLAPEDILVVAPYNLAVREIEAVVPRGVRVGTVDRFQGQEAPVVFYALTCSAGEDVPRGLDFLFDRHRMNVAISRAQCLAVLVYSPHLLEANCPTLEAMELLDGICRFVEWAGQPGKDAAATALA